jgi:hypothetical protein
MPDYKDIFETIRGDPRYQRNMDWGKPRPGHPEGRVGAHIQELEDNLEGLRHKLSETDYWRLKVLIHTHDTFKSEAQPGVPITAPNSHASLARAFLAEFCDDADMLAMVQYHDEPFALWRQCASKGNVNDERLSTLLTTSRIGTCFWLSALLMDAPTLRSASRCAGFSGGSAAKWRRASPRPTF